MAKKERIRLYTGKWDGIWNKPKYQRIREDIWKAFDGIEFIEETHQYFYKGKELIPTSNVCHMFRQPFDEDYMAEQCSIKYRNVEGHKYYGMSKDEIIEAWHAHSKKSTDHGTLIHLFGENCAYFMMRQYDRLTDDFRKRIKKDKKGNEYVEANEPKEEGVIKFWSDLPVSIVPIVFEIQMFSLKYGISGTADLLFLHDPHIEADDNDEEIRNRLYLMDYKGLPLDTPILTKNGWKNIGSIIEGDIVFDADGKETKVIHTSEVHNNPCYTIKFVDGNEMVCDGDHKWLITMLGSNREEENKPTSVFSTKLLKWYIENRTDSYYEPVIEIAKPIEGSLSLSDDYSIDKLLENDIADIENVPLSNKYLLLSYEEKKHILIDLMDKYGTIKRGMYTVETQNIGLILLISDLLCSMGIKPMVFKHWKRSYIMFYSDFTPFKGRRAKRRDTGTYEHPYRHIDEIVETETVPTRCIEVDSPTHTYLCGRNLLVTHNTNADLYKAFDNMKEPFAEMLDNDLSGYKIQAAIYSYFLETLGFRFVSRALIWLKDNGDGTGTYEKVKMESLTDILFKWLDSHPLEMLKD